MTTVVWSSATIRYPRLSYFQYRPLPCTVTFNDGGIIVGHFQSETSSVLPSCNAICHRSSCLDVIPYGAAEVRAAIQLDAVKCQCVQASIDGDAVTEGNNRGIIRWCRCYIAAIVVGRRGVTSPPSSSGGGRYIATIVVRRWALHRHYLMGLPEYHYGGKFRRRYC